MSYNYSQLTTGQRYKLEAYLQSEMPRSFITEQLGIDKSTLSRELNRNKTPKGNYVASYAVMLSKERKDRYESPRKFTCDKRMLIDTYLRQEQWSPEQIVGYCKQTGRAMVSVERIYQYIREDKLQGGDLTNT